MNVTNSVVTCIGRMLVKGFGFLNRMWLTIVHRSISVHETATARSPLVSSSRYRLNNLYDAYVTLLNFPTSPIRGNIKASLAIVLQ